MKKIISLLLLILCFALLSAYDFDGGVSEIMSSGTLEKIGETNHWVYNDLLEYDEDAWDTMAEVSLVLMYGKAGWLSSEKPEHQEFVNEVETVSALITDWMAGELWIYCIDLADILAKFDNPEFKEMELGDQLDQIYEYIADYSELELYF